MSRVTPNWMAAWMVRPGRLSVCSAVVMRTGSDQVMGAAVAGAAHSSAASAQGYGGEAR